MRGITAVALCLFVGAVAAENQCEERGGDTPPVPHPGSKCYKEDLEFDDNGEVTQEKSRPVEGIQSCDQLVRCDQNYCQWRVEKCPDGLSFDHQYNECNEPGETDCGASLFGPQGRKVVIENPARNKVLEDCQGCLNNNEKFPKDSPVVGNNKGGGGKWQQVLIAAKRDNSRYYSFAFNKKTGDGKYKMLSDIGRAKGGTIMFSSANPDSRTNTNWEVIPTQDPEIFRLRNPITKKYLSMSDQNLDVFSTNQVNKLVMRDLDDGDKGQLWKFTFV